MKLSVVIPAKNEEGAIDKTIKLLYSTLKKSNVSHELVIVDDYSTDNTWKKINFLRKEYPTISPVKNDFSPGYGMAVRKGLEKMSGDVVCIMMADGSDDPNDLVKYYGKLLETQTDCVFGSRFLRGSKVISYPLHKLVLNRLVNNFIRVLFSIPYNDVTNAFKMFRREVIEGLNPLLSRHFNLTVELPLKAIIRGYRYEVIPISWQQRKTGISKLKLREMGSRYMFIILYCFLEKWLSHGDYRRAVPNEFRQVSSA